MKQPIPAIVSFAFTVLLFASVSTGFAALVNFSGLGDLPGGIFYSCPANVSADGSVVVGFSYSSLGQEAFQWQGGTITGLGDLPDGDFISRAYGTSDDGSVIVGYGNSASGTVAVHWQDGEIYSLGARVATGVSSDGSVIVGYNFLSDPDDKDAVRWVNGEMTILGDLPGQNSSAASAVSADGSVVVGHSQSSVDDDEAFRWEDGVMTGLGDLPGGTNWSRALGISADGSVVVGQSRSAFGYEAFRWEDGLMTSLGGGLYSAALDASADGSVIVGDSGGAFIWDAENGIRNLQDVLVNDFDLDLTGWTLWSAEGISDDGLTIVGYGLNPDGYTEGWIATIPEPATLFLLTLGTLFLRKHNK